MYSRIEQIDLTKVVCLGLLSIVLACLFSALSEGPGGVACCGVQFFSLEQVDFTSIQRTAAVSGFHAARRHDPPMWSWNFVSCIW